MGNKPNWGRGAAALGQVLMQYAYAKDRQKFMEDQRKERDAEMLGRMAEQDKLFTARQIAAEERGAARWLEQEDERNPVLFPEGFQLPGGVGEMPGAGRRLGTLSDMANLQKSLNPVGTGLREYALPNGGPTLNLTDAQLAAQWRKDNPPPDKAVAPTITVPTVYGDYQVTSDRVSDLHNQLLDNGLKPNEAGVWAPMPKEPKEEKPPTYKDTTTQSKRLFGDMKSSIGTDKDGKYEVKFPQAGDIYDPASMPFDLLGDISAAYDDSVNVSGLPPTTGTGRKARDAVLSQYDIGLSESILAAMSGGIDDFIYDPRKSGDDKPYKDDRGFWKHEKRLGAAAIFGKAISSAVKDGVTKIEYDTIVKAAKDADLSMDRVFELWEDEDVRKKWEAYSAIGDM